MRRFQLLIAALLAVCSGLGCGSGQTPSVVNPFLDAPDPFITRVNGQYLLLATAGTQITLWSGATLGSVTAHSQTLWKPSDDLQEIWSPTLWHFGDRWWIYFTAKQSGGKHGIYALQSGTDDARGSYTFRGQIPLEHEAIDPSLLTVAGKQYLMYVDVDPAGFNGVRITALADPMTLAGPDRSLITPDQSWERGAGTTHNYPVAEGPTALYHAGKTFIVYSGSDTGTSVYCLGLLTYAGSGDPTLAQNWRKSGPVFSFSDANKVYGPGRGTFTQSPDGRQDWMVYHAKDTDAYTYAHRSLRMQPFTWAADGSPKFGVPVPEGPLPDVEPKELR